MLKNEKTSNVVIVFINLINNPPSKLITKRQDLPKRFGCQIKIHVYAMLIVNIVKLAKKLNLSPTTVSRALGGYSDVSELTRSRVRDFAEKYNYSPNPHASNLASNKSNAVGFVIPLYGLNHNTLNQISYFKFVAGMSNQINKENILFYMLYQLCLCL